MQSHKWLRKLTICIVCLLSYLPLAAQHKTDSLTVYFRQGLSVYEPDFNGNQERVDNFISRMQSIQQNPLQNIVSISYIAGTSIEGSRSLNEQLAKQRATTLSNLLHSKLSLANYPIESNIRIEDYIELQTLVETSHVPYKSEVLDILRNEPIEKVVDGVVTTPCKDKLEQMHDGLVWDYMLKRIFPKLRRFQMVVVIKDIVPEVTPTVEATPVAAPIVAETTEPAPSIEPTAVVENTTIVNKVSQPTGWTPQLHIKTNALGWVISQANLALELQFAKHFSFNLPVYYSGMDYFSETIKFRTLGVYPEIRGWFKENDGIFLGAHFGLAYFNYAFDEEWRYQDKDGKSPAFGGGINFGYRMPISKKHPRWKVEFSIGAGVYDVRYEKFVNMKDGPKAQGYTHDTVLAIDHLGVSFSYSLELKKRNK